MKLEEFTKHPKDMNKAELEVHMLNILEDMNSIVDMAHSRMDKENAKSNRKRNTQSLQQNSTKI